MVRRQPASKDFRADSSMDAAIGASAHALIKCNQKLKELGIDATISLPQICAIGDQSTGKSSLIEAISGIEVPKANNCCTQCPIAINLSSGSSEDSPWTCAVSIEERYSFNPAHEFKAVTKKNPLGPWQPCQLKIKKIDTTTDRDKVQRLISVAQFYALNPHLYNEFLQHGPRADVDTDQLQFSPNVVKLDITESVRPNLSFVDLPGVIANTPKTSQRYLVELVKNLVKSYAHNPSSVNMLTLPLTTDVENSKACAIIQETNAESRTLAVFTKTDCVDTNVQSDRIRRFLHQNDELGFEHGYHFVVMDKDLKDQEARRKELAFFDEKPWQGLSTELRARLGINALSTELRKLLFRKIAETLPKNLQAIDQRRKDIDNELDQLPDPVHQAQLPGQLRADLERLRSQLSLMFSGVGGEYAAERNAWQAISANFNQAIAQNRPTVILQTKLEGIALQKAQAKLDGTEDNAIEIASNDESGSVSVKPEKRTSAVATHVQPTNIPHKFSLEEIEKLNKKFHSTLVPDGIELRAIEEMERLSTLGWKPILDHFLERAFSLVADQVYQCFNHVFHKHAHVQLYGVVEDWIKEFLQSIVLAETQLADKALQREQARPFTLDRDRLRELSQNTLTVRRKIRADFRIKLLKAEIDALEGPNKRRDVTALLDSDPYDMEVQMSATTRAYYDIAAARFSDVICHSLLVHMLPRCVGELTDALSDYLGVNDHTRYDQVFIWMAEDPERTQKRQQLIRERDRLIEGRRYIDRVLGQEESPVSSTASISPIKRLFSSSCDDDLEDVLESPTKRSKHGVQDQGNAMPTRSRGITTRAQSTRESTIH